MEKDMGSQEDLEKEISWAFEGAYAILKRTLATDEYSLTLLADRIGVSQSALSQQFLGHSLRAFHRSAIVYPPAMQILSELHQRLSEIYARHYTSAANRADIAAANEIASRLNTELDGTK